MKIVINKKRAKTILAFLIGMSLVIGYTTGIGIAKLGGPKTEEDSINSAIEIKTFIEKEVDKNKDLNSILKDAKTMGKKHGLIVAFVDEGKNTTKVNIMRNLGNKSPIIKSFEIQGIIERWTFTPLFW